MFKPVLAHGNRSELAKVLGCTYQNIVKIEKGQRFSAEIYSKLCSFFGFDENTGLPLGELPEQADSASELSVPVLGYVEAGYPAAPSDSVTIDGEIDNLRIHVDCWNAIFPGVDPKGLVALKVSGTSMEPFHCEGDIIFIRHTEEIDTIRDQSKVVVFMPGDGHTFKIWRDSNILEGIRPGFKPIRIPRGTRLWGVYVCGTRMG